jgi:hypothetical protein
MKTEYSISYGDGSIVLSLKPLFKQTTLVSSFRLTNDLANALYDAKQDWDTIIRELIYGLVREFSFRLVQDLAEASQYIDDKDLQDSITAYCRKVDADAIEIISHTQFEEMYNALLKFCTNEK